MFDVLLCFLRPPRGLWGKCFREWWPYGTSREWCEVQSLGRKMPGEAEKWVSSNHLRLGLIVNFNLVYNIFWCWEKVPPWSVRGKAFNSLNEVQGILDLFEFFERLQGIVDRNLFFWSLMMPNSEFFRSPPHLFTQLSCIERTPSSSSDLSRLLGLWKLKKRIHHKSYDDFSA